MHFNLNNETILNIGGGGKRHSENALKKFNINAKCIEVDISGDNDFTIDLDKIEKLPFQNNQFSFCLLTDILEHLENFHLILKESFRVTEKILLISLPIPSNVFPSIIKNKKFRVYNKNAE